MFYTLQKYGIFGGKDGALGLRSSNLHQDGITGVEETKRILKEIPKKKCG